MLQLLSFLCCATVVAANAVFDWGSYFNTPAGAASASDCTHTQCWNEARHFCNKDTKKCAPCYTCTGINGLGTSCGLCGTSIVQTWAQSSYNNNNIQSLSTHIIPANQKEDVIPASFICMFKKPHTSRRKLVSDNRGNRRLVDSAVKALADKLKARMEKRFSGGATASSADEKVEVDNIRENLNSMSMTASPKALQVAAEDPNVAYCTPDATVTATTMQLGPTSWGLDRVDQRDNELNGLYETGRADGEGVNIYVLDTGVSKVHNDFEGRLKGGYNAVPRSTVSANDIDYDDWDDCNGHGTHCAGSAAGTLFGVAKKASIYGVRVLGKPPSPGAGRNIDRCNKSGSWSSVLAGLSWVIEQCSANGGVPCIASMSIGGGRNQAINEAIKNLRDAGIVPVVAAGNSFTDSCNDSPGSAPEAINVGATDKDNKLWWWNSRAGSNWGTCVDILAPGVGIRSSWHTTVYGSKLQTGTSMACPHVAGGAALVASVLMEEYGRKPTPQEVRVALLGRATPGKIDVTVGGGLGGQTPNKLLFTAYQAPSANFYDPTPNLTFERRQRRLRESAGSAANAAAKIDAAGR